MKIQDLFENIPSTIAKEDKDKLPFDLADDLMFFMRNDNDFYRRHYYPHVVKCISHVKQGNNLSPAVFKPMVNHAYECYTSKFPMRELPESLEEDVCEDICTKLRTEESKHIKDDIY
jgi:hypothetical protein